MVISPGPACASTFGSGFFASSARSHSFASSTVAKDWLIGSRPATRTCAWKRQPVFVLYLRTPFAFFAAFLATAASTATASFKFMSTSLSFEVAHSMHEKPRNTQCFLMLWFLIQEPRAGPQPFDLHG